jgi:hypothetical protein
MENNVIEKNAVVNELKTKKGSSFFKWMWYSFSVIFLFIGLVLLFRDVTGILEDQYIFWEKKYVGGDAYNYITTASRSTAVLIKGLIFVVLGCTSLLMGRSFNVKN